MFDWVLNTPFSIHYSVSNVFLENIQLSIPWCKIRSFAEITETNSISFEIFLGSEKTFTWLELRSSQDTLLLQITAEFIENIKGTVEQAPFTQPKWVSQPHEHPFSWKMLKEEMFGMKKDEALPKVKQFDDIEAISSSDEEQVRDYEGEVNESFLESNSGKQSSSSRKSKDRIYRESETSLSLANQNALKQYESVTDIDLNDGI